MVMCAKKDFTYRGKTMEQLMQMSVIEFAKLVTSRQRRNLLKGFDRKMEKKIEKARVLGKNAKAIRTHDRDLVVVPKMVGLKFAVYKGNSFEIRDIEPEMLGKYLGELVMTRKKIVHGKAGIGATKSSTAITARG